ncbi:MAG: tautomerase family protein [Acidimicrobiales bacterium]
MPTADFDPSYGTAERRRVVLVEITLVGPLATAPKQRLYHRIVTQLVGVVRPDDLFVIPTENGPADWSQARGEATLLTGPRH